MEADALCERYTDAFLGQPANAVTSGAFVLVGIGILAAGSRRGVPLGVPVRDRETVVFGLLVSGIGIGSFIQHGPNPDWQAYAHDLPLAAVLVFVATDAISDLRGRELSPGWWLVPSAAMVPVVAAGPRASAIVQAAMAGTAIGLNLIRAERRPMLRRTLYATLLTVATGAVIGTLTDRSALCRPDSLLQGHAIWHLLAAAALWRLAAAVGARRSPPHATTGTTPPPRAVSHAHGLG
jgi:hypothetical protein